MQIIDGSPASLDKVKSISKELLRLKLVVQNEVSKWTLNAGQDDEDHGDHHDHDDHDSKDQG